MHCDDKRTLFVLKEQIKKSWKEIPHVTHFCKLNINELIKYYNTLKYMLNKKNIKITILPFIIKAIVNTLILYPKFNAFFKNNEEIIIKKNYNIGIIKSIKNGLTTLILENVNKILEQTKELVKKCYETSK